jgi:hypothetical protein
MDAGMAGNLINGGGALLGAVVGALVGGHMASGAASRASKEQWMRDREDRRAERVEVALLEVSAQAIDISLKAATSQELPPVPELDRLWVLMMNAAMMAKPKSHLRAQLAALGEELRLAQVEDNVVRLWSACNEISALPPRWIERADAFEADRPDLAALARADYERKIAKHTPQPAHE